MINVSNRMRLIIDFAKLDRHTRLIIWHYEPAEGLALMRRFQDFVLWEVWTCAVINKIAEKLFRNLYKSAAAVHLPNHFTFRIVRTNALCKPVPALAPPHTNQGQVAFMTNLQNKDLQKEITDFSSWSQLGKNSNRLTTSARTLSKTWSQPGQNTARGKSHRPGSG
jgi:hypothetical protein